MDRNNWRKISLILAAALLISACGTNFRGMQQDKIAVVNWQRAMESHPQYQKLQQQEKILKDLLAKRQGQENLAKAQMGSLEKLRQLRQLSEDSYWQADFNTRMVEQREREAKKLQQKIAEVEKQVDKELAPRKKAIEDNYQLEIFNLRALLGAVRLKVDERQALEAKLQELQHERGKKVMELQAEKQSLMETQLGPYRKEMQQRMADAADQYQKEMLEHRKGKEQREKEMFSTAPQALRNALAIMDREIEKQQEKNEQLRKQVNGDISSQAVKLAHERGYTIVFNQFKVNIHADDITDKVVENLKKQSPK